MNLRLSIFLAVAAAVGCSELNQPDGFPEGPAANPSSDPKDDAGSGGAEPPPEPDPGGRTAAERPVTAVGGGPAVPVDVVPEGAFSEAPTRARRRMDLDQLSASLDRVTGGIGWTERRGGSDRDQFEELSGTLGKPDYVEITTEDLEPSALFQKFLDDAARSVCAKVVDRDRGAAPAERLLARQGETVEASLRRLLLRFHGRRLPVDAPELEHWRWLVRSTTHVAGNEEEAWRAVCVGLLTHPDFYSY